MKKVIDLSFSSYQDLNDPKIWLVSYCKEYKTNKLHLYVPNNSKYLHIFVGSGIGIDFLKQKF